MWAEEFTHFEGLVLDLVKPLELVQVQKNLETLLFII